VAGGWLVGDGVIGVDDDGEGGNMGDGSDLVVGILW